jgi:hypothetical protein
VKRQQGTTSSRAEKAKKYVALAAAAETAKIVDALKPKAKSQKAKKPKAKSQKAKSQKPKAKSQKPSN